MTKQNQDSGGKKESTSKAGLQVGLTRATYILKEEVVYALNNIAAVEDRYVKEVVSEALEQFIVQWESTNRKLPKRKPK